MEWQILGALNHHLLQSSGLLSTVAYRRVWDVRQIRGREYEPILFYALILFARHGQISLIDLRTIPRQLDNGAQRPGPNHVLTGKTSPTVF